MWISRFAVLDMKEWAVMGLAFLISFSSVYYSRSYRLNKEDALYVHEETLLFLHEPASLEELISLLEETGISFHREEMIWAAGIMGWRRFREGRYHFESPLSYLEFFSKTGLGLQDPQPLRIPAGASKQALKVRIAAQMRFEIEELEAAMQDYRFLERHGLEEHLVYGRLLPDTYEVYWTTSADRLLDRIMEEFDRRVTRAYSERIAELGMSVDEIVTLASIIEWEARYDHEKPMIGGLYWNRLNRRWRLQADPTVNYAKGERGRLVFADYRIDHPYYTYRIHGLPPGPITNPAYSSITAALFPEEHDFMYMVATPEGVHHFSRTYAEHRRMSREWTEWLREQRRLRAEREREEALIQESGASE